MSSCSAGYVGKPVEDTNSVMDSPKQTGEKRTTDEKETEETDEDISCNEQQKDDKLTKEKKSSRKNTSSWKKGSDIIRRKPPSILGVTGRKKRKVAFETVQAEYDSKLAKNTELSIDLPLAQERKYKDFKCDKCNSPFITNPMIRGNKVKKSDLIPSPRHKIDPETRQILQLCNACGNKRIDLVLDDLDLLIVVIMWVVIMILLWYIRLSREWHVIADTYHIPGLAFNRPKRVKKTIVRPSPEEKQNYLDDAQKYADNLVEKLDNEEASRLYCTYYTKIPCGCIQRYIGDGICKDSLDKAQNLLQITSQARKYKSMKVSLNPQDTAQKESEDLIEDSNGLIISKQQKKLTKRSKVGLGSGQKKSKPFEKFVLEQRSYLKTKHGFCETGTKRILLYSNNFLHKRLKTDPEQQCRVVRQKGKIALGKLISIEDLPTKQCCIDNCVRMALTHQRLLEEWREKSKRGQAEARRVIAEMLTPSGGSRTNCYKFISWVTGRSLTTIGKVNEQMKKTGGNREPPEHGLKSYWKKHPKPKKEKTEAKPTAKSTANVFSHESATPVIPAFIQPFGILQAAVNSSGLTAVIQNQQQQQPHPLQQQQQQSQLSQSGSSSIIAMQPSLVLQTVQGGTHAIPVNPIQQIHLLQLLQQQQQQSSHIAVAVNPATNITRQQFASAPTMVTNSGQHSTFVIAPATPHIIGSVNDAAASPLLAANLQQSTSPTSTSQQSIQPQTQYVHIAPVAAGTQGHLLLQSSLPGYVNLTPQLQAGVLPSSGNFSIPPTMNINITSSGNINVASTLASTGTLNIPSSGNMNQISSSNLSLLTPMTSSAGADQFISNENTMTLYSAGNVSQLLGAQPVQLVSQTTSTSIQRNSGPFEASFITSG